ncbi:MAG: nitroreductase family protein [Fusicatenibacter sp.]|nr:nitroreductase family protein [Fusicatenibacter sp.]
MDAIENIMRRKSIRTYSERAISEQDLHAILAAGMSGPSCVNARDWSFLVIQDKETLQKMADKNGRPAEPLRHAALGILVCGDLQKAFSKAPDYWVIDCSIAAQNMILCANALGIGSVWLGTWPQMERVKGQTELFGLPEHIVPHSILAFGYSDETGLPREEQYDEACVHMERWD